MYINQEHCLTLEQLKGYFAQQDLTIKSPTYQDLLEAGQYGELEHWLKAHNESALAEQVSQINKDLPDSELFAALKACILGGNTTPSPSLKPSFDKCFEVVRIDYKFDEDIATITLQLRIKASYNENYELKIVSSFGTKENTINPSQFKEGNVISLSFTFHKRAGMAWGQCTLFAEGQEIGQVTAANSDILTFNVNKVSFEMIKVEGGTFTMGATSEQGDDVDGREKPTHRVTLSDYYIGKYEVTQELWEAVMGNNPSLFKGSTKPIECVSWDDCNTFISKLNSLLFSQLGGKYFALPTETQWEYAARGGKKSQGYKYAGSNSISSVAWFTENSGNTTHEVGTRTPNELGLYDMSGNVYEWCQDWFGDYSSSSQTNPTGPSDGSYRVPRGGGWGNNARCCRVSYRNFYTPSFRNYNIGFRLVLLHIDKNEYKSDELHEVVKSRINDIIKMLQANKSH